MIRKHILNLFIIVSLSFKLCGQIDSLNVLLEPSSDQEVKGKLFQSIYDYYYAKEYYKHAMELAIKFNDSYRYQASSVNLASVHSSHRWRAFRQAIAYHRFIAYHPILDLHLKKKTYNYWNKTVLFLHLETTGPVNFD